MAIAATPYELKNFCGYSHQDEDFLHALQRHYVHSKTTALSRSGRIKTSFQGNAFPKPSNNTFPIPTFAYFL